MFNFQVLLSTVLMAISIKGDSWQTTIPILLFGMVGIFLVIGIIIVATYLLNKAFSKKKDKDE